MISISYLFEIDSDNLTDSIKRFVTGKARTSTELLKDYENHPHYGAMKEVLDKAPQESLNRLNKITVHQTENNRIPNESYQGIYKTKHILRQFRPETIEIATQPTAEGTKRILAHELGHHMDDFKYEDDIGERDKEVAEKYPKLTKVMSFIGGGHNDNNLEYPARKKEYVARRFAEKHDEPDEYGRQFKYKDTIDASKRFANKLTPSERAERHWQPAIKK